MYFPLQDTKRRVLLNSVLISPGKKHGENKAQIVSNQDTVCAMLNLNLKINALLFSIIGSLFR